MKNSPSVVKKEFFFPIVLTYSYLGLTPKVLALGKAQIKFGFSLAYSYL